MVLIYTILIICLIGDWLLLIGPLVLGLLFHFTNIELGVAYKFGFEKIFPWISYVFSFSSIIILVNANATDFFDNDDAEGIIALVFFLFIHWCYTIYKVSTLIKKNTKKIGLNIIEKRNDAKVTNLKMKLSKIDSEIVFLEEKQKIKSQSFKLLMLLTSCEGSGNTGIIQDDNCKEQQKINKRLDELHLQRYKYLSQINSIPHSLCEKKNEG